MYAGILLLAVPLLAAENAAVIEGRAFNRLTSAAVPGVTVRIAAASAPEKALYTAESDSGGAFRISGVGEGDYVATFDEPKGFFTRSRPAFHVGAGAVNLPVPLIPLGSLRGRVLDPDGRPAPRIRVEIFRAHYRGGSILTTDDQGRFREDRLSPGAYRLRARPVLAGTPLARRPEDISPLPARPREGERWSWAPTYFPNSIDISGAESIAVQEGAELDGYEIRLCAAPVHRLRGVVLDQEDKRVPGTAVWLLSEIGWGTAEAKVTADADGAFEFPDVRAGVWQIEAEATRGNRKWSGFTDLTMPRRDLDKVAVRIGPPGTLDGAVEGLPRESRDRLTVSLQCVGGPYGREASAAEQPDGRLYFEDVYPGRYRVEQWTAVPGYYLKAILLGPRDVTGQDVDIAAGSPPLRVVYQPNAARLRGAVENGAGVNVVVIDADPNSIIPGSLRVALCDAEGRFSLEGLRPGAWHAFAFDTSDNMNTGAIRDAVFARGLARQAEVLHLKEGETATVNLKISPWLVM